MTLFDETNNPYSDSSTTTLTEQQSTDTQTEHSADADDQKPAADDFASALENFTNESEELESDDHVLKGTVIKLTSTHVVVDIGAKSEGMVPIAEVMDHRGGPKVQAGDEIHVVRDKGETEEELECAKKSWRREKKKKNTKKRRGKLGGKRKKKKTPERAPSPPKARS